MPTNILRNHRPRPGPSATLGPGPHRLLLVAGQVQLELELGSSLAVQRLLAALPIYSTAEIWGASINFEVPVHTGRDRSARIIATPGEVYFWAEQERIVIPFGRTPISRGNECRLQAPCNVIGRVIGDATALSVVTPGEKVGLTAPRT